MATSPPEKEVHFEDLLSLTGGTGRWQLLLLSWMSVFFLTVPFTCFSMMYMGETPAFFCADGHPENVSFASLSSSAEKCRAPDGEPCRRWVYDPDVPGPSVVTQWDLVCERRPLLSTIQSTIMFGGLIGSLAAGGVGDRFGRRVAYLCLLVVYVTGALLSASAWSYEVFVLTSFTTGVGWMGVISSSCVLAVELTCLRWRALAGQLLMLPTALGQMLLAAAAYRLRVWWQLQLALAAPCVSFLFSYWLVPESPRWLILRGRDAEALRVLAGAARVNGRDLPPEAQLQRMLKDVRRCELAAEEAAPGDGSYTDAARLWRSPRLRRWMLVTGVCWAGGAISYFGLSFDVTQLSENPYLAGALSGLVEVPAYCMGLVQNRFGRRPVACIAFLLAGICMLLVLVDRDPKFWLAVGLLGKFFASCTYAMLFVYTPEYIPTSVRTVGLGFANVCSRIGAMTAPYIVDLIREVDRAAPSVVIGACCFLVGLLALLLPETAGRRLPETVAELEAGVLDEPSDQKTGGPDGDGQDEGPQLVALRAVNGAPARAEDKATVCVEKRKCTPPSRSAAESTCTPPPKLAGDDTYSPPSRLAVEATCSLPPGSAAEDTHSPPSGSAVEDTCSPPSESAAEDTHSLPSGSTAEDTYSPLSGSAVEDTCSPPSGSAVEDMSSAPSGSAVEDTCPAPLGPALEDTCSSPSESAVKDMCTPPSGLTVEDRSSSPQGSVVENTCSSLSGSAVEGMCSLLSGSAVERT